jgi:serine phosphatase RsbU (regulator of sigma subunit)
VKEAKQDLKKVQADANEEAQKLEKEQEWETFKSDAEITIRNNEIRIGELRVKLRKEGKILDPMYEKKIETLEQQNKDLKKRIEDYEKNQSDWEIFKREFKHDMDELGKALKGLTVDNKN